MVELQSVRGLWAAVAAVLLLATVAVSGQPVNQNVDQELQALPDPLKFLLVQRLLDARVPDGPRPVSAEERLAQDLILLAHAAANDVQFHRLGVPAGTIKTFCHVENGKQCREACFHLGDSACLDGNISGNGNDNAFLEGGFHPGK